MNKDTAPKPETLVKILFTQTIPDVSWYRHPSWKVGQYKRFRHYMTMAQNANEFEFFTDTSSKDDSTP